MSTYAEQTGWRDYLRFFPAASREHVEELKEERWSWRGLEVHVDRLARPSAPLKLILVHGAGAYGRVIAPLALNLGVELVAPDLPGYGLSRTHGRVVDYEDWVDCVGDLVARERARDARPIVLFGGSMGGMLAYAAASRGNVQGLIATCFLDPRSKDVRHAISRWPSLDRFVMPLLGMLSFLLDRIPVPMRWITNMSKMANDPAVGALCAADPLGGGGSVALRWVRTFLASSPPVEPEDFDACPVLMVHPAADLWTPVRVSMPFFDRLRCEKSLVLLEGGGHFPLEPAALDQLDEAVRAFLSLLTEIPPPQVSQQSLDVQAAARGTLEDRVRVEA